MSYVSEIFQPNAIAYDLFQLLTDRGELLGNGVSRHVYPYGLDSRMVIKFEQEENFQNTAEWNVWNHVKYMDIAKWFAPVEFISPCGRILIQRRTQPFKTDTQLPKSVPAFFTDTKVDNWGMLKGKAVCHDYGYHRLLEMGMTKRMRAPAWF
ncbi:hypothetical protein NLU14_08670 [Marinobacter sp. 71-i]|uniref:Uncharacterized protein n=1 Tax=Marinobacter iranensis TaxID=2962607 RepID=A0ABT5Y9F0_9GAMM|nr:hypothetical protein [Marinobacter iranensis]MDF0750302.1 hypothetical protein [Marinobacter iranensis]